VSQADLLLDDLDEDEVPVTLRRKRQLEDTELDMTPMIDMTFQLLIFFLVTFKSDPSGGVPLPGAKFGEAIPAKNAIMVSVKKGEGTGPPLIYKGKATDATKLIKTDDLKDQEAELEAYIAEESAKDANKTYIMIVAGKDVKYKDVKRIAETAGRIAEIQQLYVAVLEVK
jgi:biopolymer transport protein ExbD